MSQAKYDPEGRAERLVFVPLSAGQVFILRRLVNQAVDDDQGEFSEIEAEHYMRLRRELSAAWRDATRS